MNHQQINLNYQNFTKDEQVSPLFSSQQLKESLLLESPPFSRVYKGITLDMVRPWYHDHMPSYRAVERGYALGFCDYPETEEWPTSSSSSSSGESWHSALSHQPRAWRGFPTRSTRWGSLRPGGYTYGGRVGGRLSGHRPYSDWRGLSYR